jgi:hypothetical protein
MGSSLLKCRAVLCSGGIFHDYILLDAPEQERVCRITAGQGTGEAGSVSHSLVRFRVVTTC